MRKYSSSFLSILISFIILFPGSCKEKPQRTVHRSFYYWKSVFRLQPAEAEILTNLHIENLYIKLFDVVWNNERKKAEPAAQINFSQPPPAAIKIIPVIFITNETLQQLPLTQTDSLAGNIIKLLSTLVSNASLYLSGEIQIDCDWTAGTKEKYFRLLIALKKNDFIKNKILSVTIRLHQLKYISENGIPPADKGLLMCYNMGNLRHPETKNSIIEEGELKKYVNRLSLYPLQLDVALPVFGWWIWFRGDYYKGLIHSEEIKLLNNPSEKIIIRNDTVINGYNFARGDWLRHEDSPAESIAEVTKILRHKLPGDRISIILYHLDENNLSKYSTHELESFFNGFR
jgi:hypothetical protein